MTSLDTKGTGRIAAPFVIMDIVQIRNLSRPLAAPLGAGYCSSFLCRFRGLMFRSRLSPGQGLLLVQPHDNRLDSAIHMLFVFMDLAVIWINADRLVVDTVLARAWRPFYAPRQPACFILEIHPDRLVDFQIGDHVEFLNE